MLERLFSTRGQYQLYSIGVAIGLSVYLLGGFLLAKMMFTSEPFIPSALQIAGVVLCTSLFGVMHRASMKDLDSPGN